MCRTGAIVVRRNEAPAEFYSTRRKINWPLQMAGRFLFQNGKGDELRNRRRTKPQTFGKRLRLELQGLFVRNYSACRRRGAKRDGFKNGFFWRVNFWLYFRHPASAQLRGSHCSSKAQGMMHTQNGRRTVNRKKWIVEKQRGKDEAKGHAQGRHPSLCTGMLCQGHCSSSLTIV